LRLQPGLFVAVISFIGLCACAGTTGNSQSSSANTVTVLTYHNDNLRTGLNPNETILTKSNVSATTFGLIGELSVTGLVDAEPLYVPNLMIKGATHNVLFVVTEGDMAYAFDADTPGPSLWQSSLIPNTETPSDDRGCSEVEPEIGITSTPVIDLYAGPNGTIFAVAMSKDPSGNYHHRLHALDMTTGSDRIDAQEVQATFPGNGTSSSGETQTFQPGSYEERAALLLVNGVIYTAWTSHCDSPNYTSWVISYSESTLQLTAPVGSLTVPEMLAVTPARSRPHVSSANARIRRPRHLPNLVICIALSSKFASTHRIWTPRFFG
jgi:hypothetical protein